MRECVCMRVCTTLRLTAVQLADTPHCQNKDARRGTAMHPAITPIPPSHSPLHPHKTTRCLFPQTAVRKCRPVKVTKRHHSLQIDVEKGAPCDQKCLRWAVTACVDHISGAGRGFCGQGKVSKCVVWTAALSQPFVEQLPRVTERDSLCACMW
jgi:hypothetical protein